VNEVGEDDRGSIECTASGMGRRTLRAEREPITRGTGYCCDDGEHLRDRHLKTVKTIQK
jgi:hypothetical protein